MRLNSGDQAFPDVNIICCHNFYANKEFDTDLGPIIFPEFRYIENLFSNIILTKRADLSTFFNVTIVKMAVSVGCVDRHKNSREQNSIFVLPTGNSRKIWSDGASGKSVDTHHNGRYR